MKNPINVFRLLVEIVLSVASAEFVVMLILPLIARGVGETVEAAFDATMLAIIAGPVILWRVRAAIRRTQLPDSTPASARDLRLRLAVVGVVLGGSATAILTEISLHRSAYLEAHSRFDRLVEREVRQIQDRANRVFYGLNGARALYAASQQVERREFQAYVAARDLPREFPGVIGMGVLKRTTHAALEGFTDIERGDGAPSFVVKPSAHGSTLGELYIVTNCFPQPVNELLWGQDFGADPVRREAIERAIATGSPTTSARLVNSSGGTDFLYLVPVFRNGSRPHNPDERRKDLEAIVFAMVDLELALSGLDSPEAREIDLELFDGDNLSLASLLLDRDGDLEGRPDSALEEHDRARFFRTTAPIRVGGRTWTARLHTSELFDAEVNAWLAPATGIGGILLSILAAAALWNIGTARDRAEVIARQRTSELQDALRDVQAFRDALEDKSIVSETDEHGTIVAVNDHFCRISGYAREELIGGDHKVLSSGVHPSSFWQDLRKELAAEGCCRRQVCNRAKDGSLYWIEMIVVRFAGSGGRGERLVSICFDITAQKQAERRLRLVIDTALDAVVAMDGSGVVSEWNQQAEKTFGWTREEAIGRPMDELIIPEEYRARHRAGLARYLQGGEPRVLGKRVEIPALRKDGQRITTELAITALRSDEHGACGGVSFNAFLRDISDRKKAEAELVAARNRAESASRTKSEFLANMSHEIRTPLTAILGFVDLLREDGELSLAADQRGQAIDTIRKAGQHLLTILNDILDLSKIEADRLKIERVDTPLVALLAEVASLCRPRAAGKGVELVACADSMIPDRILSDPTRLRQIIMNLVGNAVKFTEHGAVRVHASTTTDARGLMLHIDVQDTGVGMTAEQAEQLFQNFAQADASTTRKFGGTGLGLVICRRLATLMGGDVRLVHSELGKGSRFRLSLPIEPAQGAVLTDRIDAISETTRDAGEHRALALRGRVLLAEDGVDNQRLISFHLRKAGAEVEIAPNGLVALEMLRAAEASGRPFELLVTDMQMPEMDGYSLASRLREEGSQIPIIALTAHAMAEDRARCMQAGCNDYATKPIDKKQLLGTCAHWLDTRAQRNAA